MVIWNIPKHSTEKQLYGRFQNILDAVTVQLYTTWGQPDLNFVHGTSLIWDSESVRNKQIQRYKDRYKDRRVTYWDRPYRVWPIWKYLCASRYFMWNYSPNGQNLWKREQKPYDQSELLSFSMNYSYYPTFGTLREIRVFGFFLGSDS